MLSFLQDLDNDLKKALMIQLRNLWTHTSTCIEDNTLTLGETAFVLEEGLTVSGKPLKDHEEVVGHARAIDLIYALIEKESPFGQKELFDLHKAVQTQVVFDIYKPLGTWKIEPNSTVGVVGNKQIIFEYAPPEAVPSLMDSWFKRFREMDKNLKQADKQQALRCYTELHLSFVRIHPFFDGNGRLARLISNIPVLKAGLPPIIIPSLQRKQYMDALSKYHHSVGQIKKGDQLSPKREASKSFTLFCKEAWKDSLALVDEIHRKQKERNSGT